MPANNSKAALQTVPVGGLFEMLAMDFLGPLPTTEQGNNYILVVADYFTKWTEAFALQDQTAKTTTETLVNDVITRFEMPIVLHSDQERNVERALVREVCKILGIRKYRTTAYHPQWDGLVEIMNRTLAKFFVQVCRHPSEGLGQVDSNCIVCISHFSTKFYSVQSL